MQCIKRHTIPLEALYQVVSPEIGHWVHVGALKDYQAALILCHPTTGVSFCSPYCLVQHAEYNQDQNTHNTHDVASYHQFLHLVQLLSAQNVKKRKKKYQIMETSKYVCSKCKEKIKISNYGNFQASILCFNYAEQT